MIIRKPIQDGRDGERSGDRKLSNADPFNLKNTAKVHTMKLDDLIEAADRHGYTVEDVEQAMHVVVDDHDYWDKRGPEALLKAVRRLREGPPKEE